MLQACNTTRKINTKEPNTLQSQHKLCNGSLGCVPLEECAPSFLDYAWRYLGPFSISLLIEETFDENFPLLSLSTTHKSKTINLHTICYQVDMDPPPHVHPRLLSSPLNSHLSTPHQNLKVNKWTISLSFARCTLLKDAWRNQINGWMRSSHLILSQWLRSSQVNLNSKSTFLKFP